ncbi:PQQ-binding-like beta-propeller repeat protein [Streptomyces sp. NPDC003035]|uniref:protein kinase domain-containing protein n=1 Tax=Streptomyces sp. NPDC003035 TaxID=3364676 RepID=UPI0036CC7144
MLSPLTHTDPAAIATYRLLARLGSGGMGTVYLARTPGGRTVALKTMHARLAAEAGFRTRFRLETDAARIIGARHGAAVVDADPLAETPWLATEYVLGPPLDDAVALCGRLPEATVRALGAALAGGLAQLHSSDVVHRDLKPSNVLVTAYGPKIIDFGIARAAGDDHLTRTGAAAGTPAFMSPEQAGGLEHTPAGDVFALAGVLVFAATGHGPFGTGAPADLLYRVRYAEPDLTDVPEPLLPLLTACLSKDPSARPTTTDLTTHLHDGRGEFADHLPPHLLTDIARRATEVWHHHPHRLPAPADDPYAETVAASGSSARLTRRKLFALGGGALLATAGAGTGVWAWLSEKQPDDPKLPTAPLLGEAPPSLWSRDMAVPLKDERAYPMLAGGNVALVAGMGVAFADMKSGEISGVCSVETAPRTAVSDGRQVYVVARRMEDEHHDLMVRTVDTERYELSRAGVTVKGLNANTYSTQLLCAAEGVVYLVGAKGTRASLGSTHILAVDTRTGKELWRRDLPNRQEGDGSHVVTSAVRGDLLIALEHGDRIEKTTLVVARDRATGATRWEKKIPISVANAGRNPLCLDDRYVYTGGEVLAAYRLADGREAWTYRISAVDPLSAPVLKDGVVYAVTNGAVCAVSAASGQVLWTERVNATNPALPESDQSLAVGERCVYFRSELGLAALDLKTRKRAWVYQTDVDHLLPQAREERMFATGDGFLIALPLK